MGGPAPLCEHGGRKYTCIPCGGTGICFDETHNEKPRRKDRCKKCAGSNICKHGVIKNDCIECGGASICEHGRRKRRCTICGTGSAICEHKKNRQNCLECKGSLFCEHNKKRTRCKICDGSELCKTPLCETRGIKKYNGYCLPCCIHFCPEIEISRNFKTKENDVVERVIEEFPDFGWVADKRIEDGCSKRRPDLLLELGSHVIIIEVDENKHDTYDCSCENKRLMEISQDLGHRPIVFIRFNPDDYITIEGDKIKSCWKVNGYGVLQIDKDKIDEWNNRISCLYSQIQYWVENIPTKIIETIELFY